MEKLTTMRLPAVLDPGRVTYSWVPDWELVPVPWTKAGPQELVSCGVRYSKVVGLFWFWYSVQIQPWLRATFESRTSSIFPAKRSVASSRC
jgi:hypothetical protein